MSDAYGQQREVRARQRTTRSAAVPNLAPVADEHLDDETSAAFALGAIDEAERNLVEFHTRFCPRCAATVERDVRTTGMLPFLASPATPGIDVKAALFARIAYAERAATMAPAMIEAQAVAPTVTLPASYPLPAAIVPRSGSGATPASAATRSLGWVGSMLSVPLLVALVATGFWGLQMREQLASQGSQVSALQAQVANFGSSQTYQLQPGMAMPQAEGKLLLGANKQSGMLEVDLNSSKAAGTYEVWGWNENGYGPISDLQVGADGKGATPINLDQPYGSYDSVQIVSKARALEGRTGEDDVVLQLGNASLGSTGSGLVPMP